MSAITRCLGGRRKLHNSDAALVDVPSAETRFIGNYGKW